jgi:hypothetical protein
MEMRPSVCKRKKPYKVSNAGKIDVIVMDNHMYVAKPSE